MPIRNAGELLKEGVLHSHTMFTKLSPTIIMFNGKEEQFTIENTENME